MLTLSPPPPPLPGPPRKEDSLILWPYPGSVTLGRSHSLWISWFCTPGASEIPWHFAHLDIRCLGLQSPWEPEGWLCHPCPSLVLKVISSQRAGNAPVEQV